MIYVNSVSYYQKKGNYFVLTTPRGMNVSFNIIIMDLSGMTRYKQFLSFPRKDCVFTAALMRKIDI